MKSYLDPGQMVRLGQAVALLGVKEVIRQVKENPFGFEGVDEELLNQAAAECQIRILEHRPLDIYFSKVEM